MASHTRSEASRPEAESAGAAATLGPETSWLCFRVCAVEYAIPLSDMAEVSAGRSRYLIPTISLEVAGIINLRGEPLPALDAGMLLVGVPCRADRHVLILERGLLRIGLFVDAVLRIVRDLPRELAEDYADTDELRSDLRASCFSERATKRGNKIRLVDSDALLARAVALMSDGGNQEGEGRCHTGF
jgi:chemotaxis signal transduction protein